MTYPKLFIGAFKFNLFIYFLIKKDAIKTAIANSIMVTPKKIPCEH